VVYKESLISKPLYTRIQEYITELVLNGKLKPEAKLQSEREFSDELGVSRMTVRKALTELVNDGLLERRHGSGTYVAKPKVTYESHEMLNYPQAMLTRNISTSSQLIEFEEIVASRRLSETLQIQIGDPIFRVIVLRLANRVPAVLERVFFPRALFPDLQEWDLEKSSLYDLLTTIYKITPERISQTVEAVSATDAVARQLRVEENSPLLMLTRVIYSKANGKPVVFAQDFLRSDYARIHTDVSLEDIDQVQASREERGGENSIQQVLEQ
jgi:GntR family transcriptional regulator